MFLLYLWYYRKRKCWCIFSSLSHSWIAHTCWVSPNISFSNRLLAKYSSHVQATLVLAYPMFWEPIIWPIIGCGAPADILSVKLESHPKLDDIHYEIKSWSLYSIPLFKYKKLETLRFALASSIGLKFQLHYTAWFRVKVSYLSTITKFVVYHSISIRMLHNLWNICDLWIWFTITII